MNVLTNVELKEREHKTWTAAAAGWRRRDELLRKGAAPVTDRMLELAGLSVGDRLLDIASGTGEPAIAAARIVGENGQVTGTDLSDAMLSVAREKAEQAGLENIKFVCVDGEELSSPPKSFDAVTIRWGLMFMPDPGACLQRAHKVLKDDGRIVVACWATPEQNPFVALLIQVLRNYMEVPTPPPNTPNIFSFADPDRLRRLMLSSDFRNFEIESIEFDVIEVEDGKAYWDTISDLAAPIMTLVEKLTGDTRERYIHEVIEKANALKVGKTLRMKGTTWVASAIR